MDIFNQSKYTTWYFKIINSAQCRNNCDIYTEGHHIIPRSLGGDDSSQNIARLTSREHYICHRLLTKMTTGKDRSLMLFALWSMSNQKGDYRPDRNYNIPSKIYSNLREQVSILLKEVNTGRRYVNRKPPTYSPEQREERRQRLIALNKKRAYRKLSEKTKDKIRAKRALQDTSYMIGRKHSEETKAKIRAKRALQTNVKNQYSKSLPKSP